jgi:hypothetical protein
MVQTAASTVTLTGIKSVWITKGCADPGAVIRKLLSIQLGAPLVGLVNR